MSKVEQLRRQWPEKSVVFWRVHALYLSAEKSYQYLSLSVVSDDISACHPCVMYSAWNPKDNYDMACEFFVVQFNGFTSLTSYFHVTYFIRSEERRVGKEC
jgi:hypothetical protein